MKNLAGSALVAGSCLFAFFQNKLPAIAKQKYAAFSRYFFDPASLATPE